jgi:predicted DNA-binding protein
MGQRKKNQAEKVTEVVLLRLTKSAKRKLDAISKKEARTTSEMVRLIIDDALGINKVFSRLIKPRIKQK